MATVSGTGGSGKKYEKNTVTGAITVTRPDGSKSTISPGEKGYAATNTAAKNDGVSWSSGSSSSGSSSSKSSGSSSSGNNKSSGSSSGNKNSLYQQDYNQQMVDAANRYAQTGNYSDWQAVLDAAGLRDQKISDNNLTGVQSTYQILSSLQDLKNQGDALQPQQNYQAALQELQNLVAAQQQPVQEFTDTKNYDLAQSITNQLAALDYADWTESDQYKALAERYGEAGRLSMQDVLGQIASRTGGLASTYATTAAQQQYNNYMAQLEEVARQQYAEDRNDLQANANLALSMGDRDYERYVDQLNQSNTDKSFALDAINTLLGYTSQDKQNAYNQQLYEQQTAAEEAAARKADARNRVYDYLVNMGGSLSSLNPDLISASGLTTAELAQMAAAWQMANPELAAVYSAGNGAYSNSMTGSGNKSSAYSSSTGSGDKTGSGTYSAAAQKVLTGLESMYGSISNQKPDNDGVYPVEKSIVQYCDEGVITDDEAVAMLRHFGYDPSKHFTDL